MARALNLRTTKDVWTAHRYVRVEIPADHARSLAGDLMKAAARADEGVA
jgi:hypothetical protein